MSEAQGHVARDGARRIEPCFRVGPQKLKNSPSPKAWAAARKFEMKVFGLEVIGSREAITAH